MDLMPIKKKTHLIFIRGLPGSGKTTISDFLNLDLNGGVIHVDEFKREALEILKNDSHSLVKSLNWSYGRTIDKLSELYWKKEHIIVDEIICDAQFYEKLHEFSRKNSCIEYWFRIQRTIDELLETESTRSRKIKNTKEQLVKMEESVARIKIANEYVVYNEKVEDTAEYILKIVKNKF